MKSLLFVVPALPSPPTTGGEIFNERLARGLAPEWDLTVVTLADLGLDRDSTPEEFSRGLMDAASRTTPGPVLLDTYLASRFAPAIPGLRAAGFGPLIGFGQAWYPTRYESPLAQMKAQWKLTRVLRELDHHVVVSHALKSEYTRMAIRKDRVDVVLPGFDLTSDPPAARTRRHGPLRVRTAGTYMPAKGQHLLVEAIERLEARNPNLASVMTVEAIGSKAQVPDFVNDLEKRALALPEGLLRLSGPMSQADLWEAFRNTDVFVFEATGEGLGMVVLEAMLCGAVPVVSLDGPLKEIVGDAGFVVPRDPHAIARVLDALASDHELELRREAAIHRAQALAPTWGQTIERMSRIMDEVSTPREPEAQDRPKARLLGRLASWSSAH